MKNANRITSPPLPLSGLHHGFFIRWFHSIACALIIVHLGYQTFLFGAKVNEYRKNIFGLLINIDFVRKILMVACFWFIR